MLTFDFETTNHSKGSALDPRNRILMVCWQIDGEPVKRWRGADIMSASAFWADVDSVDTLCAYNKKFEQLWFLRLGVDIDRWRWHDPMLAEKVLQGNRRVKFSLGEVALRYGLDAKDPLIDALMKSGVCPSEMPPLRLMARCARDVRTTADLMHAQLGFLIQQQKLHIYRTRCALGDVLSHIETEGMLLDKQRVTEEYLRLLAERRNLEAELDALAPGVNLRSPDQLAHFLYGELKFEELKNARGKPIRNKPSKQFPDGRPKTDKLTLSKLKCETYEQKRFIELRTVYGKVNAALTKNMEFFYGVCYEKNGHFHAQFNQTVAATHRLTSSGIPLEFKGFKGKQKSVQFQNMPRQYKRLFTAPDGYLIAECDAIQLEFRVAAFLGQDEVAINDILDPYFDAHCKSASVMCDIDYGHFLERYRSGDKNFSQARTDAKPETFKPLYGGTKGTPEQEKWYKEFQERYAGIYSVQEGWVADVARDSRLTLGWGMEFYWPAEYNSRGVLIDRSTGRPVGPQVFNYPVQSLATAEIVPIALISLWKRCKEENLDVKFVNTVHDSVICYVKDDEYTRRAFVEACHKAFTRDVYDYLHLHYGLDFNVPLGCEIKIGKFWGEGSEYIFDDVTEWNNGKD